MSTEDILSLLAQVGPTSKDAPSPQDDSADEIYKQTSEDNRTVCRLLKIHLDDFYDDINIPFGYFRDANWKISKVLYDNDDVLFYNKKYMTEEDNTRFYEVFDKFIDMIEDIMNPKSKLVIFLKKWTDMSNLRWKANESRSYLKSLLVHKKYQYISPEYTTSIYCDLCEQYPNDVDKIKGNLTKRLDKIVQEVRTEVREFRKNYNEIVTSYTYEYPLHVQDKDIYVLGFINSIILTIISFAEKLIDLHVYAIHPIVNSVIEYYTPINDINLYDPADNGYRRICIV